MAVTSDSIRDRKKKLREEERRNKEKAAQEAGKQSGPEGQKKKKKKLPSPNKADEIRQKNADKQNKYEEKQAVKEDIAAARAEGREQKEKRKAEKKAKKSAKKVVNDQKAAADAVVNQRPPAGYQDASNPDATPTIMPNGQSLIRDEANMQYIDTDTGETYPFGPNETAAMKKIIARRIARERAGAINQERVGPDGKIRMDQYDAALLAEARKADMQAGHTNTRAKPKGQPTGDLTEVDTPAKDGPQQKDVMPEVDDPMGAPPAPKPPAANNDAKSVAEAILAESNRTGKAPSEIIAEMQEEGVALPPGIEEWIPEGAMPAPKVEPEAEAPPVEDAPPAQRDAPNRVDPDKFVDPRGPVSDSPFPHHKRAPEGNAIGGTRFKDLDQFLDWERDQKRRMRIRPFGGAQSEWDAIRSDGPLYSEMSDLDRWRAREVFPENNRVIPKKTPEELEQQKAQIEQDAKDPKVTARRIDQLWNRGEITTQERQELLGILETGEEGHAQVKDTLKILGRNKRVRRNQEIEADEDLRQNRVDANGMLRAGNGGLLLQEQLANGSPQEQDAAWSMMVANGMISEFAPRPDFFRRSGGGGGGGVVPSPNPNDSLPTQNSFKRDQIIKYHPMYSSPDDFKGMTQGQLDELFEDIQKPAAAQGQREGMFDSVDESIAAGNGQDWGYQDYVDDAKRRAEIAKGAGLTEDEAVAIERRVEQRLFRAFAPEQQRLYQQIIGSTDKPAEREIVFNGLPRYIQEDLQQLYHMVMTAEVPDNILKTGPDAVLNYQKGLWMQKMQEVSPMQAQLYNELFYHLQSVNTMPTASIGGPSFEVGDMDQGPLLA